LSIFVFKSNPPSTSVGIFSPLLLNSVDKIWAHIDGGAKFWAVIKNLLPAASGRNAALTCFNFII